MQTPPPIVADDDTAIKRVRGAILHLLNSLRPDGTTLRSLVSYTDHATTAIADAVPLAWLPATVVALPAQRRNQYVALAVVTAVLAAAALAGRAIARRRAPPPPVPRALNAVRAIFDECRAARALVLTGPSGVGRGELAALLLREYGPFLRRVPRLTTRAPVPPPAVSTALRGGALPFDSAPCANEWAAALAEVYPGWAGREGATVPASAHASAHAPASAGATAAAHASAGGVVDGADDAAAEDSRHSASGSAAAGAAGGLGAGEGEVCVSLGEFRTAVQAGALLQFAQSPLDGHWSGYRAADVAAVSHAGAVPLLLLPLGASAAGMGVSCLLLPASVDGLELKLTHKVLAAAGPGRAESGLGAGTGGKGVASMDSLLRAAAWEVEGAREGAFDACIVHSSVESSMAELNALVLRAYPWLRHALAVLRAAQAGS